MGVPVRHIARAPLELRCPERGRLFVGLFVAIALAEYPLLGMAVRHSFPQMPTFGVTPCPVVIFTYGLLLWTEWPVPQRLLVIPQLWSLLGVSAALTLGIDEDLGLVVAGLLGTAPLLRRDHRVAVRRLYAGRVREPSPIPGLFQVTADTTAEQLRERPTARANSKAGWVRHRTGVCSDAGPGAPSAAQARVRVLSDARATRQNRRDGAVPGPSRIRARLERVSLGRMAGTMRRRT